jgi:sporulation protein YlmC with PRC-barrel domain
MMKATRELQGRMLIGLSDGRKLGEIKDFYLDGNAHTISAVFLGTEGLVNRRYFVVPQSRVQLMGIDAWLISGDNPTIELGELAGSQDMLAVGDLQGRDIATDGGTKIGRVGDVFVDEKARVLGIALDKVYVQGPLAERQRIVRDAITNLGSKDAPLIVDLSRAESMMFDV